MRKIGRPLKNVWFSVCDLPSPVLPNIDTHFTSLSSASIAATAAAAAVAASVLLCVDVAPRLFDDAFTVMPFMLPNFNI